MTNVELSRINWAGAEPGFPVRALIVDDERLSRERVRSLLQCAEGIEVVGECANGIEALRAIQEREPDLVFLDVEMPELGGLAVLEALAGHSCPEVVFVTAHDKYLQRAFEVHALDYLRKPFTDQRFFDAVRHACRRVEERLGHARREGISSLVSDLRRRSSASRTHLVVRAKDRPIFYVIWAKDIDWIEANDGGVLVHAGTSVYASRHTLARVETQLESGMFMRIHRSYIVNRMRIRSVKPLWKGEYLITLASGKSLGTGRTYRAAVEAFLEGA